jgi:hypothetical protein
VVRVRTFTTPREKLPELPGLFLSPWYVAVIVTGRETIKGVYLVWQDPEEREQDALEKSPAPPLVHTTVPVGDFPVTFAVHEEEEPKVTGDGVHVTEVPCDAP